MGSTVRSLGSVALSTIEAGAGGRPLLLSHGFTGAKEDFADHVDRFADQGWWVVAPDLRGHGLSDQPGDEADYSLDRYAEDLEELADDLGWSTFAMVGHSMGGMVAQELALRTPSRLDRLVLMDTHHGPIEGLDIETVAIGAEIVRTQGVAALIEVLASLPKPPRAPADERLRAERRGYAEFSDAKALRCAPAMYAAMATELVARPDRLEALAGLAMPVQVVVGEQDQAFVAAAHRMATAIEGATLVVVPDAAHSPQFENPDVWWEAVSGFLGADLLVD